jgi:hypothetical protein
MEHPRLQTKGHHRSAEHQCPVNVTAQLGRLPGSKQNRDGDIEEKEQYEERLGAREQVRLVTQHAPGRADDEREEKAGQVERPPGSEPCDRQNAAIQYCVITEQDDVIALTGRCQHRCQEAASGCEKCERL